jgi:hypothetical protein
MSGTVSVVPEPLPLLPLLHATAATATRATPTNLRM